MTGRGLAAFARASSTRTFLILAVAASGVGAAFAWAISVAWFPVIERGIQALPPEAAIRSSRLLWPDPQTRRLADSPTLDWVVRPTVQPGPDPLGQTSDLRIELRPSALRLQGSLGHLDVPYSSSWDVPLGRIPALAAWKSWKSYVRLLFGMGVGLLLMACWTLMASAYCLPAWILSHLVGKRPSVGQAWRLSAASLLVGAFIGAAGVVAYAHGFIRIPGLMASQAVHVPVPWLWLFWGILCLDRGGRSKSGRS